MKIILLGYMASGKSTIGKLIAKEYKLQFVDLDDYIEQKEQKTIPEVFKDNGEIYFRKKETEYLIELLNKKEDFVLSLGGGTPCYGNNMEHIKLAEGVCSVYLKANSNTIVERLKKEKENRPLVAELNDEDLLEFVAKHLFERNYYYNMAHFKVKIDNKSIDEICNETYSLLT
ncbi:shikimate kinase [Tenacibaculum sp. 190524A02b]|uniref:shikimate kinase n=1 Tax=Tenacibaculum vairaonense TaxID=3137860 RepID=UPI0031FA9916